MRILHMKLQIDKLTMFSFTCIMQELLDILTGSIQLFAQEDIGIFFIPIGQLIANMNFVNYECTTILESSKKKLINIYW